MYDWNRPSEIGQSFGADALATQFDTQLGVTRGLTEGTEVATRAGWVRAEDLRAGDQVMTFDGGFQTLREIGCDLMWSGAGDCPEAFWPLFVPAGTIGNRREMVVLPDQAVLIETAMTAEMTGDPFTMIPGLALEALPGVVRQAPFGLLETFELVFDSEQLVFTEHGALLHCHAGLSPLQAMLGGQDMEDLYQIMPLGQARLLMQAVAQGQIKLEDTCGLARVA